MKLFEAVRMDWSLHMAEDWDTIHYTVFHDGHMKKVIKNGIGVVMGQQEIQLDEERLQTLKKLIAVMPQESAHHCACDGEGWRLPSYGAHGKILYRTEGYVYGTEILEKITELFA